MEIDMDTRETVAIRIQDYLWLAEERARFYYYRSRKQYGRYTELGDLIGLGYKALVKAWRKFDPQRGITFESYASKMIDNHLRAYRRTQRRIPRDKVGLFDRMQKVKAHLEQQLGRPCYDTELAEGLVISLEDLNKLQQYDYSLISLDTESEREDGKTKLMDTLGDKSISQDDKISIADPMEHCLKAALQPIERQILLLFYLQGFSGPQVIKITGLEVDVNRIQYLKRRALTKMRRCLKLSKASKFLRSK